MNYAQKIFSIIKEKADSKLKDSFINVLYLKKSGYAVGELAELIIVENINKRLNSFLKAYHIGNKTKNKYDSKTDIIIKFNNRNVPFSIKTGSKNRIKIKNGISKSLIELFNEEFIDKKEIIQKIKKEISTSLHILHLNKKKDFFYIDLKKINLKNLDTIKISKNNIILKDKNKNTLIFFDLNRLVIYANKKCLNTLDSFKLGRDNSLDKKHKGENLLINNIIMNVCLCDIPTLRKIDKIIRKKV